MLYGAEEGLETRYGQEILVMQEMGWSWPDLMAAPRGLVQEILLRVNARNKWQREKGRMDRALAAARAAARK